MNDVDPYKTPEATVEDVPKDPQLAYFTVGTLKLVVLSICTFGLYELYWCYKNWVCVKERLDLEIWPFWRAFFAPIWAFSLASYIRDHARHAGVSSSLSPALAGGAYFVLSVLWRLPDPYWLISALSFVPLISIQNTAARVAVAVDGNDDRLKRFNAWNWVGVVLGGLWYLLVFAGLMIPVEES